MDSTDRMRTLRWACLLLSVYGVSSVEKDPGWPDTFVGAVFEFAVKDSDHSAGYSRTEALQHMERSLEAFEEAARDAKRQGAQIIVFPEYGLFGINFTRTSMYPYLEEVPDPNITSWNPCLEPQRFDNTEVLFRFSCMAKENDLFVVGNMGSVEPCTSQSHPNCPSDGRFQFNTNVAFNSDGLLISRYRKYNLYFEDHYYNTPNQVDYAIFNTPFAGNFAMFICYDLLFGSPAMELVKRYEVQNIAFSTAWFDHLPLLSSIQAQRAFSAGFGITLLASNLNIPEKGAFGSGIYFPGGSKYRHANGSHLLVAHVPLWSKDALSQEIPFTEKKINQWEGYSHTVDVEKTGEEPPFNQIMMYDEYTMVSLSGDRGKRRICQGDVCCSVKYQRTTNSSELYALAAYDGKHTIRQVFYHQICTLLRCAGSRRESCGKPTSHAVTTFNFELWGNFGTKYVLPAILTDGMHLQEPDSFGQLKDGRYSIAARMSEGLVTAMLYSRAYDRD